MLSERRIGILVTFHGGKSGEGKSLIAQNLAAALAGDQHRVLVLDLDPGLGSGPSARWNLTPGPAFSEVANRLNQLDPLTLRGFFSSSPGGVEVVTLGPNAQAARAVTSQQVLRGLFWFRQAFDVVVVDGLVGWDPLVLGVLDASDLVFAVCGPELVSLRQLQADIQRFHEHKYPAIRVGILLNRTELSEALQPAHVEQALPGHRLWAALPYDPHAVESANRGLDLVSRFPHSAWTKAIHQLARQVLQITASAHSPEEPQTSEEKRKGKARSDRDQVKQRIHTRLLEQEELKSLALDTLRLPQGQVWLREKVESVVTSLMAVEAPDLDQREDRERLVQEVVDEALGLGPLEDLMRDPEVTEVMVNGPDQIFVERQGRLEADGRTFLSERQLMTVIERIVAPLGRRVDESQPFVDARLPDGSRVHAIIPPLALNGPTLTIRKFGREQLTWEELIRRGSLTLAMAEFLQACVRGRKNILISGGTGSGKTTFLNVLASAIPGTERIITVEDAAELDLPQAHVVTLEARPANIEGKGVVTIRDLVRNCLRMRPDRIVVGECRAGEALDMLQAMNTGHDGSLTTAHANSPRDSLSRLETMVLMSGMDLPVRAIREQIASALHLVVQQARLQDGSRKITQIAEVSGWDNGMVGLHEVFVYRQTGLDRAGKVQGEFEPTGYVPQCSKELQAKGVQVDLKWFKQ